ncbi:uncharacterized protein LOC133506688 [Syngnathoides biaculeatus]|uniref:uncharacterized protein LOC133506688 n=1 Tax=Syngnathoides biaculeatus TaxID=300417 RepID=UPI002ADE2751|nr:uncharacterized protein LOC133506688 [Syngnathoides biaculeatus]
MGASSIIIMLHIQGQSLEVRCTYPSGDQWKAKFFSRHDDNMTSNRLIWTEEHNKWVEKGRFSLFDNSTEAFFIVKMDNLLPKDSGKYSCGVDGYLGSNQSIFIQLNVSTVNGTLLTLNTTMADKLHPMLFVAAAMGTVAICVCLYTLILLVTMKPRRMMSRQNREMSSDYETMMPGVMSEGHSGGSNLECVTHSDLPKDLTVKQQESEDTFRRSEYLNLDLSQVEEHVYYSLHGKKTPKHKHLATEDSSVFKS